MTTTYELYTNENGTPKAVEGKAPAIIERVEALEETLDNGVVTSVNGNTGDVKVDVGVTSVNGQTGAVSIDAGVTSVNGNTGDITPEQTGCLPLSGGNVTGNLTVQSKNIVRSINGVNADPSGNVPLAVNDGTVSLVTSGTWATTNKQTTFTVTGVTPYKPLRLIVKPSANKDCRTGPVSGVVETVSNVLTSNGGRDTTNYIAIYDSDGKAGALVCIPTATSVTFQYYIAASTPYYIYQ